MDCYSSLAITPAPMAGTPSGSRLSEEPIEVNLDQENQKSFRKTSRRGFLYGIDRNNILTPRHTQQTIEVDDDNDDNGTKSKLGLAHKYGTRTAKHGRAGDTHDKYDMKFHPADVKLRPKRAAKRRSGSRSLSVSMRREEGTQLSSAHDENSEELSQANGSRTEEVNAKREPDSRASRHSKRKAAQKYINYSAKHHKDDHGIPGYTYKAKQLTQQGKTLDDKDTAGDNVANKRQKVSMSRKTETKSPLPTQGSDEVNKLVEETLLNLSQIPTSSARTAANLAAQRGSILEDHGVSSGSAGGPKSDVQRMRGESSPASPAPRHETQDPDSTLNHQLTSSSSENVDDIDDTTSRGSDAPTAEARETAQLTAQSALNSMFEQVISSDGYDDDPFGDLERLRDQSLLEGTTVQHEVSEVDTNKADEEVESNGACDSSRENLEADDTQEVDEVGKPDESRDETREAAVQALLQNHNVTSSQRTVPNSSTSDGL